MKVRVKALRNLTPDPIAIVLSSGEIIIAPEERSPRVREIAVRIGSIELDGSRIPLWEKRPGAVVGLPALEPEVLYIVPPPVAARVRHPRFVVPHEVVEDDEGRIIRCRGFARIAS